MRTSVVKSWIKILLCVCCFALLVLMVYRVGFSQLCQTLISMPLTIIGCVAIWGAGYLLNALSFEQILYSKGNLGESDGNHLSRWQVFRLTVIGYAINYITPFGLLGGEPYRVIALRPILGTEKATQSVLLYSMMHIGSHFCLWLLSIVWIVIALREMVEGYWGTVIIIFTVVGLLLSLFWYLYRHGVAASFLRKWVNWPLLNPNFLSVGAFLRALIFELLSRLLTVFEYWLIMQVLGYDAFDYSCALFVVAFSSLVANLLFFAPLQMGTREGGIFLALQLLLPYFVTGTIGGSLFSLAVTLSFATRLREFIWIAIGLLFMSVSGAFDKEKVKK